MAKSPHDDDLDAYRDKRDPGRTNEPFGPGAEPVRSLGPTRHGAFVCHLHQATRKHYDLRLEMGGTLLSFAIPKGPTVDPEDKRLAIQTENHPIEYVDFEAVIPEGNYGAGSMIVWDRGRVRYVEAPAEEGLVNGKLDLELFGQKLRGRFALIRTSGRKPGEKMPAQPQWLFVKKADAFVEKGKDIGAALPHSILSGLTVEELADAPRLAAEIEAEAARLGAPERRVDGRKIQPMLCSTEGVALAAPGSFYELKLDGVRIVAEKDEGDVALTYRSGRPAASTYPEIARAIRAMAPRRLVLDGEIVTFDDEGRPSFEKLARRIQAHRPGDVALAMLSVPVVYLAFDVLQIGARDVTGLPLRERKALLMKLVRGKGLVRALDHLEDDGRPLYELCKARGLEGVVIKKASAPYRQGPRRYADWVKLKCERDAEFVIVGYTKGENSRERLGALVLASHDDHGVLRLRGKAGSGLGDEVIDGLLRDFASMTVPKCPAEGELEDPLPKHVFVRPELVASVRYLGWSDDGRLRFPVFRGLRADVSPTDCREAPRQNDAVVTASPDEPAAQSPASDTRAVGTRGLVLTNQRKVFWPDHGYTKGDLCSYYDAIAPTLLPFLRDRPVVMVRYPDGVTGKSFFQWRVPKGVPEWVKTLQLRREDEDGKDVGTFLVNDLDTLLVLANFGTIPIHVIAGRAATLRECDFLTVDFDLGGAPLRDGVTLARTLKEILDEAGLTGFPKTSGKTGLHVLVPLGPGIPYDAAKMLCELLGRLVVARHPDVATMERMKEQRGGRVYVDTGQTGRARTIVAPYSARESAFAGVSTPLLWDEVGWALDPRAFTILTVPRRVADHGDPLKTFLDVRPDIPAALGKLAPLVGKGAA